MSLYEFFKIKLQLLLDSLFNALCSVPQWCLTLCDPRTIALLAPLSIGFSRQEYWSGLPFPSLGDLPDPGIQPLPWVGVLWPLSLASKAEEEIRIICAHALILLALSTLSLAAPLLSALSTALLYPNPSGRTFTCITTCLLRRHEVQMAPLPSPTTCPPSQSPSFSAPPRTCFLFPPPGVAAHAPQIPVLHTSPHTLASLSSFACYLGPQHSLPASFLPVHASSGKVTFLNCKSFGGSWSILCKLLIALGTQAPGILSRAHVAGQCPTSDLTCLTCAVLRCLVMSDSLQLPGL